MPCSSQSATDIATRPDRQNCGQLTTAEERRQAIPTAQQSLTARASSNAKRQSLQTDLGKSNLDIISLTIFS
jgi:hypothetical protein